MLLVISRVTLIREWWDGMSMRRDFSELLADENFGSLLNRMTRRCLSWDEFLECPQPHDMSPIETWRVLNDLNHSLSIPVDISDLDDNDYWYRRTLEIDDTTRVVSCACSINSRLHRIMSAAAGQQFLVKSRIEETIGAAQLDGIEVSEKEANILLRLDRAPQSATERLLVNTLAAMDSLPNYVNEPFSRDMFTQMRDTLLDGVDVAELRVQPPRHGLLLGFVIPDESKIQRYAERQMDRVAAYLNGTTADRDDIPVLQGLIAADAMRFYHPVGIVSSQIGRLAARLFALKSGLPVLGHLPIARAKVDWETGAIKPPLVSFDPDAYVTLRQRSWLDLTPHQTLAGQLTLIALRDLEARISTWERRDDEMRDILLKDPLLNQRQRSILARALRAPEAEFRIRYHQTNHNIHYTTARRDLLELHEKGYLLMRQQGKAFVFVRGPQLAGLEAMRIR
ncbi:MAG: Fic family protein [Coriobacteriia bacterium]